MSMRSHDYQVNYFADPFDIATKYMFVNTCGFISSWREEAESTVKQLLKANKTVYLMGCAVQYYKQLTKSKSIKDVHYLSWEDMNKIGIKELFQWYNSKVYDEFRFPTSPRVYTNIDQRFEYLKIAEGCDNHCTFCIIPQIRGKLTSRTVPDILKEAENMIKNGIQEIILIAQDTTRYGYDRFGKSVLLTLLKKLDKIPGDFRYRLLYLYPDIMTTSHIKEMKKLKKFIPYFDIPLQHISSSVLKKMGRFGDEVSIKKFIDQIKDSFPVRFIRTNLIIGFPGETKQDFEKLVKFVEETKFDNIALFEYHDEPLAASSKLPNKVDNHEIRKRFTKMRQLVNKQLLENEHARKWTKEIGYIMEIDIHTLVVRPQLHCPEIDSYDEIGLEQVIWAFDKKKELEIGDKIIYLV